MAKVIKIGSSLGVTLPRGILKKLALVRGDAVEVRYNKRRGLVEIEPLVVVDSPELEHSFLGKVQILSRKYADKLQELEDEW